MRNMCATRLDRYELKHLAYTWDLHEVYLAVDRLSAAQKDASTQTVWWVYLVIIWSWSIEQLRRQNGTTYVLQDALGGMRPPCVVEKSAHAANVQIHPWILCS